MFEQFIPLIILFFVIIDPPVSYAFFVVNTKSLTNTEKRKIANFAVILAAAISYGFLFFGEHILTLFSTDINSFRVAGGIILGILGAKMALGLTMKGVDDVKGSGKAIASIIATPFLSGPACITTIILSANDYGHLVTGLSLGVVLTVTAILFYLSTYFKKLEGKTAIQVTSTILGLITLAWGVHFIKTGILG